ncbi:MAG: hypothetical protein AAF217_12410 [Pseudomonadota bacterium]
MSRFSDAALLKGDYAEMLKEPPKEAEWKKTACDNTSEKVAQEIGKQIFGFQKAIDTKKEKLEVISYSALGPFKVLAVMPIEGDLMRVDGVRADGNTPVSVIQHVNQLSLTFTKVPNAEKAEDEDDGLQIGYVIFDELKDRKKKRDAAKRKKAPAKKTTRRAKS